MSTPAALALLRGLALGGACLGLQPPGAAPRHGVRLGLPKLVWLSVLDGGGLVDPLGPVYLMARCVSTLFGPGFALVSAALGAWWLVAFPAALAARASRHKSLPVIVPAVLWILMAFTLPGASVVPLPALLLFAALQGLAFAFILYRWDFLTMLVAMFTFETWVLAYPIYSIFREVEPLKAASGLLPWYLLLLFAALVGLRPQLAAGWRRVAAVFE